MQSLLYAPRPIHFDRFHEPAKTQHHHPLSLLVAGQREPVPVAWPPRAAGAVARDVLAAAPHPSAVLAAPWALREGLPGPPAALSAPPPPPPRAAGREARPKACSTSSWIPR